MSYSVKTMDTRSITNWKEQELYVMKNIGKKYSGEHSEQFARF